MSDDEIKKILNALVLSYKADIPCTLSADDVSKLLDYIKTLVYHITKLEGSDAN